MQNKISFTSRPRCGCPLLQIWHFSIIMPHRSLSIPIKQLYLRSSPFPSNDLPLGLITGLTPLLIFKYVGIKSPTPSRCHATRAWRSVLAWVLGSIRLKPLALKHLARKPEAGDSHGYLCMLRRPSSLRWSRSPLRKEAASCPGASLFDPIHRDTISKIYLCKFH